jgi:hypothetical protein
MGAACVAWLPAAAVELNVALQWLWFAFIRFLKKVELLQQQDTPLYMAVAGYSTRAATQYYVGICYMIS